jgi:hypothetical protein
MCSVGRLSDRLRRSRFLPSASRVCERDRGSSPSGLIALYRRVGRGTGLVAANGHSRVTPSSIGPPLVRSADAYGAVTIMQWERCEQIALQGNTVNSVWGGRQNLALPVWVGLWTGARSKVGRPVGRYRSTCSQTTRRAPRGAAAIGLSSFSRCSRAALISTNDRVAPGSAAFVFALPRWSVSVGCTVVSGVAWAPSVAA